MSLKEKRKLLFDKNKPQNLDGIIAMYVAALRLRYPDETEGLSCPEFVYSKYDNPCNSTMLKFRESFEYMTWDDLKAQEPEMLFEKVNLFINDVCAWPAKGKLKRTGLNRKLARARNEIKKHAKRLNSYRKEKGVEPLITSNDQIQAFRAFTGCVKRQWKKGVCATVAPSILADVEASAPDLLGV